MGQLEIEKELWVPEGISSVDFMKNDLASGMYSIKIEDGRSAYLLRMVVVR